MAATVAPSADQAADLMQNLSLDSQPKALEISEPNKKLSANQYGTVNSNDTMNVQSQPYERSMTPLLQDFMEPAMCYLPNGGYPSPAYYYGGYDGSTDWDAHTRFMTQDGVEMTPEMYGDNGAMGYHPGFGYGAYAPYSPAGSPVPTVGHDGQLYGPQHYQYPTPYFQPLTPTNGLFSPSPVVPAQVDVSTSAAPDQKPVSVESANGIASGGGVKGSNVSAPAKSSYQNSSYNSNAAFGKGVPVAGVFPASGYQDPRYTSDVLRSTHWSDGSDGQAKSGIANSNDNYVPSSRNQNLPQQSHYMGLHQPRPMSGVGRAQGFINRMYPNKYYGQYGNTVRSTYGYVANGYDSRSNGGRGWFAVDNKYKPRGRGNGFYGYGSENMEGLNELNRGPRAKGLKSLKSLAPVTIAIRGQDVLLNETTDADKDKSSVVPDREQYNLADFTVEYTNAKFFIIKSYSEDDVHKSIKYNMWASTPNGNKKLDAAYQEAQEKSNGCPVFLFFSVNTSGQFVGLAEMASSVDFNKNLEYWQQDKWNGCFSLKWHIVKDMPNSLLKHIILENNENKPVTNSRDTQEVKLEQGLQMLKLFKEHSCKTCILDDFSFYETRQKTIQEKKEKQQQFQKQVWGGKQTDEKNKEGTNVELQSRQLLNISSETINDSTQLNFLNGDRKVSDNESDAITTNGQMGTKPVAVLEKKIVANGVSNGV